MIERYTLPEMGAVWSDAAKYRQWTAVELAAVDAWEALGTIPEADARAIRERVQPVDPARVDEIERTTQHDVIAFLTVLCEPIGEASRWIHYGMTSSDLLDTALALQMCEALDLIAAKAARLTQALKARALEFRDTVCVARTHGVHAEPSTFGLRLAVWAFEARRMETRLRLAREEIAVGKIAGPVGTYASVPPFVEEHVCRTLELRPVDAETQVIQRDRHAAVVAQCALVAAMLEDIATEIRHRQRTEVREVEEPFGSGQKGSSAMPHKRNPIICERITGMARIVRAAVVPAIENMTLWHERDISHSSVERVILPDVTIGLDYALHLTLKVVEGMRVFPERMRANLDATRGLVYSAAVLLALVERGMSREGAYAAVQTAAMRTWEGGPPFRDTLLAEPDVAAVIDGAGLDALMDPSRYLVHTEQVFKRVEEL